MKRVILESPFSGNLVQRWANRHYARACMSDCLDRGESPMVSHLLFTQVLDDKNPNDRLLGMDAGFSWIAVAQACVVYTDRGISSGMKDGIQRAKAAGLQIEHRTLRPTPRSGLPPARP